MMGIKELEEIMVEHGVVLRAIPKRIEKIYETEHLHMYPDAKIEYSDAYKKEMLIVETFPEIGGKFIFVEEQTTASWVHFSADKCYDTIEEAIEALLENKKENLK